MSGASPEALRPAERSLDRARRRLVAGLRHQRGEEAVPRGVADADVLRRRRQVLDQARRLAGGDAERMGAVWAGERPSSFAAAAAAPNTPQVAVMCQPRA